MIISIKMISSHSALVILLALAACVLAERKLPSFVEKCKRNDPELGECMKKMIHSFKPYLDKGLEELRLPSMNPFYLKKAALKVDFAKAEFQDVNMYMANNFDVKDFKIDLDSPTIWMNLTFPYMELECTYIADGKVINIAFHGEGKMVMNFTNTNLTTVMHGEKFTKNDQEYIEWKSEENKILQDSLEYFYLSDLFEGNPQLTEHLLAVVKENQKELTPDVIPIVAQIYGQVFRLLFNGPFSLFSLKELFDE